MIALIDGDVIAYTCGFASEQRFFTVGPATFSYKSEANAYCDAEGIPYEEIEMEQDPEPDYIAYGNVNNIMSAIIKEVKAREVYVYLSGQDRPTFREELDPSYKANRSGAPKPVHLENIRGYLQTQRKAVVTDGIEADDALGIAHYKFFLDDDLDDTIICSIDKDLLTVPGWNYNWQKDRNERFTWVSEEDADYNFYFQMLTGDTVDNIPGLPGIGPKRAKKILSECNSGSREELERGVAEAYREKAKEISKRFERSWKEHLYVQAELLWIMREQGVSWEPIITELKEGM